MDRLNQLRGEAGGSKDSTLDTTAPPSEGYMTANESTSKYYSLSEDDTTFDISAIKDVSLATTATAESEESISNPDELISNLSPIGAKGDVLDYKIGKQIEAANILSGGVDIFDDNENSYDGDELVIDDNADDEKSNPELKHGESLSVDMESPLIGEEADIGSKDTEVVLQIDGKNVDAIDIGNGLYLYRKEGEEELAAVQIIDDDQHQPSFKFLKVRENAEGNLEVYEEIEIEVPKEVPVKEGKATNKNTSSHVPIKNINKVISESASNKNVERKVKTPQKEPTSTSSEVETKAIKDISVENKSDVNFNGKMIKFTDSRKSPVISSYTPMTYHSTPNKEGKPLTKTMVDQQLHPSRHSDNVKKTIEVHTDSSKQRASEPHMKNKDSEDNKFTEVCATEKEIIFDEQIEKPSPTIEEKIVEVPEITNEIKPSDQIASEEVIVTTEEENITDSNVPMDVDEVDTVVPIDVQEITKDLQIGKEVVSIEVSNTKTTKTGDKILNSTSTELLSLEVKTSTNDNLDSETDNIMIKDSIAEPSKTNQEFDSILQKKVSETENKIVKEEQSSQNVKMSIIKDTLNVTKQIANKEANPTSAKTSFITDIKESKPTESSAKSEANMVISKEVINETMVLDDNLTAVKKQHSQIPIIRTTNMMEEIIEPNRTENIKIKTNKEKTNPKRMEEKQTGLITTANVAAVKSIDESKTIDLSCLKIPEKPTNAPKAEPNISPGKKDDKSIAPVEINKKIAIKEKNICSIDKDPVKKQSVQTVKPAPFIGEKIDKKAVILPPAPLKPVIAETIKTTKVEPTVPKVESVKIVTTNMPFNHGAGSSSIDKKVTDQSIKNQIEPRDKKNIFKISPEPKPINNNHAAVPFGKWTEANRQEFLNKFKAKVPAASSNGNQIKNSNDLNRRDVLKKIDSQRQSSNALSKTQEANKLAIKNETAFSKTNVIPQESKIPVKSEAHEIKVKPVADKAIEKQEKPNKSQAVLHSTKTATSCDTKKDVKKRTEVNYQDLIDKTIEDMLHRGASSKSQDEVNQNASEETSAQPKNTKSYPQNYPPIDEVATLDAIEMKMNELHGIPFIERPPHELPQVLKSEVKGNPKPDNEKQAVSNKTTKIPNLVPFSNKTQNTLKENVMEVDSEEEIIEHEPITGDIQPSKKILVTKTSSTEKLSESTEKLVTEAPKKEAIITEKDFDKFARRNSITYENCITVNFDGKEPHNVIKTIVEKDTVAKSYSRSDLSRVDNKATVPNKYHNVRQNTHTNKLQPVNKFEQVNDESSNRNQSKLQKAYHSALTAKRQMECPITIIEDKPVKVVFMENVEYVPSQLNVQGQELSPVKKLAAEPDVTIGTVDSLDSDLLDTGDDVKSQDEVKVKTKHQRKQVLTPVEEPELELIEPTDLGLEVSPKKKRKTDDDKADKTLKYPMRKKMYMLGSSGAEEKQANTTDVPKNPLKESVNRNENVNAHRSSVSAIDNLVKAAELLETQIENAISSDSPNSDSQQSTPVKRGRGRPRKYPLPDGATDKSKVPSPQKKPKLIDANQTKRDTISDEEGSDGEIVKENWTMGKINENIVCPICNKLFRTENVVFKHVKHCTGPSPNRSDSDKRSPRRTRYSQDSDDTKSHESKFDDMDTDNEKLSTLKELKETPKKRNSKDSVSKSDKDDIIIIEDTPDTQKSEKADERKQHESRKQKPTKLYKNNGFVCEFCGSKFRQLSHYVKHRLQQHKKEDAKKLEKDVQATNISVYSCEVCKKDFRKLHHLVQHRIIHNPRSAPVRTLRKTSSEQTESVIETEKSNSKPSEDPSAGFRCEPCDKSFRKLHHLVEHRETHGGINRHKSTSITPNNPEKPVSVHACEVCKKTFRKLHLLVEHKEQHMDIESDDKSVKSTLSTKDIIHECSLCYMVFPNEHSLTKHTVICQRKKRQSKQKQAEGTAVTEDGIETPKADTEMTEDVESTKPIAGEIRNNVESKDDDHEKEKVVEEIDLSKDKHDATLEEVINNESTPSKEVKGIKENPVDQHTNTLPLKRDNVECNKLNIKKEEVAEIPEKIKKVDEYEIAKVRDTPKKKTPLKEKAAPMMTKRPKLSATPVPIVEKTKPAVESSDDDEVRYMFNPNFKVEETEEKLFEKVRAKKRSSLQIERPNSKDLVKRRISLQHPPKIPRLKQKSVEHNTSAVKNVAKTPKLETVPSTDSDDSDVKYSFPKTVPVKSSKTVPDRAAKVVERKSPRKSLAEKRKTLSAIAKRKSLGKAVTARHKPSPVKQIKRRTMEVEHRCDCGQLFSSAALLSRHTTLAHTPPRIRRRRSPPPEENKPIIKPAPRKSITDTQTKAKQNAASRKSSVRSETSTSNINIKLNKSASKAGKKSIDKGTKSSGDTRKSKAEKSDATPSAKPRRTGAHRGVPVPEKMKKLMQKNK